MARQPAAQASAPGTFASIFESIVDNVSQVIHGKEDPIRLALVCLLSEGHLLLEDVPGVGKTTLAKALARSFDLQCRRIQFTPDLLPSDVTGVSVYDRGSGSFSFRPGPVFANVVIADEINRASPKTQSALLEAMQERQVTIDATTHVLPSPFLVIGTQNPIEHEGTYPLPVSQLDRFLMRIHLGYPDPTAEVDILVRHGVDEPLVDLESVATPEQVLELGKRVRDVHCSEAVQRYIVDLANATRTHPAVLLGMSPRAALALQRAARAWAVLHGRDFVVPDDVKALALPVIGHRLELRTARTAGSDHVITVVNELLAKVAVLENERASL